MFSNRIKKINPSFVRDIIKLISRKDIISLAGGLPNDKFFPRKELLSSAKKILTNKKTSSDALQYGDSAGYYPLRQAIAKTYWEKDKIKVKPEEIIITTGSQQALDIITKIFINKNDIVLTENPTFLAALQIFDSYESNIKSVPILNDGPDVSKLPKNQKIKLFYTIPNFQNPTGLTWSTKIRKQVISWAKENNTILIEDDPYGEIRFSGKRQTPLLKLNKNVLHLGSFSKILAPGLRLGWVIAKDKKVYEKLILAKQTTDLHTSNLSQLITWGFYKNFKPQKHIQKISSFYKEQKEYMIECIKKYLPDIKYTNPEGGMFLWLTFPKTINTDELIKFAVKEKVAFVPGSSFFAEKIQYNNMRLNFSKPTKQEIKKGVKRLSVAYQKYNKSKHSK